MSKKLIDYIVSSLLILVVTFSVIYYYINYDGIEQYQKINFPEQKLLIWIGLLFLLLLILLPIMRWYRRSKHHDLIIRFNRNLSKWKLVLLIYIVVVYIFVVRTFYVYPGFVMLSLLISMSFIIIVYEIPEFLEESGITNEGIVYKGKYYQWNDIRSYTWERGNTLRLNFYARKVLFIEYSPLLEIELSRSFHEKIDHILEKEIGNN